MNEKRLDVSSFIIAKEEQERKLNKISSDILMVELSLKGLIFDKDSILHITFDDNVLYWDKDKQRLMLKDQDINKPLIEHKATKRLETYCYFNEFINLCKKGIF